MLFSRYSFRLIGKAGEFPCYLRGSALKNFISPFRLLLLSPFWAHVAAVEHPVIAHIDAHMGRACGVVGLFKEYQGAGTGAFRGDVGAHAPQTLRAQPAEHRLFLLCKELILADELRQSPLHLRPRQFGGSRASGTDDKKAFAFIPSILARQPCTGFPLAAMLLIGSSDKARSMPYKSPPVFRDFPPCLPIGLRKRRNLTEKMRKRKDIFDDD